MMSQQNTGASRDEPSELGYGRYGGEQPYASQQEQVPALQFQEGRAEKIYQPTRDMTMLYRLLTMIFALVALMAFVYICLVLVGGTAGIVSFCAASLTIMVIASTMISVKREGDK